VQSAKSLPHPKMFSQPPTLKELLEHLGGPTLVGKRLGVRPQAVSQWVKSGRVPVERVPGLVRLAKDQGKAYGPELFRSDLDWSALR
jgi:DNA-binding transcriptional regulator YdaS (Cro superfamily)